MEQTVTGLGSVELAARAFPQGQEKYILSSFSVAFLDRTSALRGVVREGCQALTVWAGSFGKEQDTHSSLTFSFLWDLSYWMLGDEAWGQEPWASSILALCHQHWGTTLAFLRPCAPCLGSFCLPFKSPLPP